MKKPAAVGRCLEQAGQLHTTDAFLAATPTNET